MLKKSERLSRAEFSKYFKLGKRINLNNFTIIECPLPHLKVAVVVGKKVSKLAVVRNKIKRQIYGKIISLKTPNSTGAYLVLVKPTFNNLTAKQRKVALENELGGVIK